MHPRALGQRNDEAHRRILAAAVRLGTDPELVTRLQTLHDRDPAVKAMLEREAVAQVLEAVVNARQSVASAKVAVQAARTKAEGR